MTCAALTVEAYPPLPALKGLGKLADIRPCILVDSREQAPLIFTRLESIRGGLQSGDYSILGFEHLFAVERKSIGDLVQCCTRERDRFERELHRLRGFRFARLLIVGSVEAIERHEYKSKVEPKVILNSLKAFEVRYNVPVVFIPDSADAARQVESWAFWFSRELVRGVNDLLRGHRRRNRCGDV